MRSMQAFSTVILVIILTTLAMPHLINSAERTRKLQHTVRVMGSHVPPGYNDEDDDSSLLDSSYYPYYYLSK